MPLVLIAAVVVALVVSAIGSRAWRTGDVNNGKVSFRQQMKANIIDLKDEYQRRQNTQPPATRGASCRPSAL